MSRREHIHALLDEAEAQLAVIGQEYEASLEAKSIDPRLGVQIKNFLENVRAPLDYLAAEIAEDVLGLELERTPSFPVSSENEEKFEKWMKKNFPGLAETRPDLLSLLRSFQKFAGSKWSALPALVDLVNENKHNKLSPQVRSEKRSLEIEFPGGSSIQMGPGSSISGTGTISSGGGTISLFGDTISGDSPSRRAKNVKQTVQVWVAFRFEDTGQEVLGQLRSVLSQVRGIVEAVEPLIFSQSAEE